MTLATEYQQM